MEALSTILSFLLCGNFHQFFPDEPNEIRCAGSLAALFIHTYQEQKYVLPINDCHSLKVVFSLTIEPKKLCNSCTNQ